MKEPLPQRIKKFLCLVNGKYTHSNEGQQTF